MRTCREPGCGKRHSAKGYCRGHYKTIWRRSQGLCHDCPRETRSMRCRECKAKERRRSRRTDRASAVK